MDRELESKGREFVDGAKQWATEVLLTGQGGDGGVFLAVQRSPVPPHHRLDKPQLFGTIIDSDQLPGAMNRARIFARFLEATGFACVIPMQGLEAVIDESLSEKPTPPIGSQEMERLFSGAKEHKVVTAICVITEHVGLGVELWYARVTDPGKDLEFLQAPKDAQFGAGFLGVLPDSAYPAEGGSGN